MGKRWIFFLAAIMCIGCLMAKSGDNVSVADDFVSAKQAIVMDWESGECLFEKNGNKKCVPSSMTKLMTLYILFEEIVSGRIKLDDEFSVSKIAQKMPGSRSFLQAGSKVKVEDLIRCIVVHSGNDACIVVAEGISGDVDAFVDSMNEKAEEFGLTSTHFTNPTGLPDDELFSSVHDIAVISRRIISDFPQFYHYFSEKVFTVNSITQQNRNTLLGNSLKVDGLKTGKTNAGGYGIAASAENEGRRLIVVINGCKNNRARVRDTNRLLALGFGEYAPLKIAESGKPITNVAVWLGVKEYVRLCTHEDVVISIPKKYRKSFKVEARLLEPIDAPVELGTKLGELTYSYGNTLRSYDLFSCESIARVRFWERAKLSLSRLIFGEKHRANVAPVTAGDDAGIKNAGRLH
ncbi:MAG: D-alanyl-D-alanine carboxypeptidase [Holosporaceae bacterium]|nr:D-alanyl-D-alanine carboxypeptidase [Holosporaceae bacterium]